jgi:hypothetical protein
MGSELADKWYRDADSWEKMANEGEGDVIGEIWRERAGTLRVCASELKEYMERENNEHAD